MYSFGPPKHAEPSLKSSILSPLSAPNLLDFKGLLWYTKGVEMMSGMAGATKVVLGKR